MVLTQIHAWHWAAFFFIILSLLAVDLGVFHRSARVVPFKEAVLWSLVWLLLAMIFGGVLTQWRGRQEAVEYLAGYVIELSLSLDNVFAIALIFACFGVAQERQHRILFWGILGALAMRGLLIGLGAALIQTFSWILFVFGAFLIFTGFKWALSKQQPVEPEKNRVLRIARKILPVAANFDGQKLWTRVGGRLVLTPLALVLLMVETTDLIFAVDSIPAIFAVTQKGFIVFSSNIFAVLGLRSLYFVLAGAMRYFRFLRIGLAFVLVLIGVKMIASRWYPIPVGVSLCGIAAVIGISILASVLAASQTVKKTSQPPRC
jgi:tellurite resistance protein TerC